MSFNYRNFKIEDVRGSEGLKVGDYIELILNRENDNKDLPVTVFGYVERLIRDEDPTVNDDISIREVSFWHPDLKCKIELDIWQVRRRGELFLSARRIERIIKVR